MKLSSRQNMFKKSFKLVKKLWKDAKNGRTENKDLELLNQAMLNLCSIEMEISNSSENLNSEDLISETSQVSSTSAVRKESSLEGSTSSVDLNLENPSIVYAPEFMQNEGGEENVPQLGVEPETQNLESEIVTSEEEAKDRAKQAYLSQLLGPDISFSVVFKKVNNISSPSNADHITPASSPDNTIADITNSSPLSNTEDTTLFSTDINPLFENISHSPRNPPLDNVVLEYPDNISSSDTSNSSSHLDISHLFSTHDAVDLPSSENLNADDITTNADDITTNADNITTNTKNITTNTNNITTNTDNITSISTPSQIQENITPDFPPDPDNITLQSSLTLNPENIDLLLLPDQIPVAFLPIMERKASFDTSKNQYFEYINNFDYFNYEEGYFDEMDAKLLGTPPESTISTANVTDNVTEAEVISKNTNTEQIISNENIEPENEVTKTSEPEPETFINHTMEIELITTGEIQLEETQPDFPHHTEVLQVESANEQEIESKNDQKVEFNLEESQSDLVHHNGVLQVDSENDHEIDSENVHEVEFNLEETEAENDQETEFNLDESQSDLVPHDEVFQVDSENDQKAVSENDQEIEVKPENGTVIDSNKQEEIDVVMQKETEVVIEKESDVTVQEEMDVVIEKDIEVVIEKNSKDDSSEMNVFPQLTLSQEKEMEEFFKKPFTVSNDSEIISNIEVNMTIEDSLDQKDAQSSSTKTSSSTRRKRMKIEFDSEEGTSTEEVSYAHSDHYLSLEDIRLTNERRPVAAASPSQQQEGFFTRMRRFFCCCRPDVEIIRDC